MADAKITDLTALTTVDAADLLAIVDDVAGTPNTKKITVADLLALLGFKGAMVRRASDLTAQNWTSVTAISWDTEVYDVGDWHDNAVNPSRITVPSGLGITKVDLSFNLRLTNLAASNFVSIAVSKNGNSDYNGVAQASFEVSATINQSFSCASVGVPCTAGDYFEAVVLVESDTSVDLVALRTNFAVVARDRGI